MFKVDACYQEENTTTNEFFREEVQPLIVDFCNMRKSSAVLLMGPAKSGKTSLLTHSQGLLSQSIQSILSKTKEENLTFLRMSSFMVARGSIFDLLQEKDILLSSHTLKELNVGYGSKIQGLQERLITTQNQATELLD